MKNKLMNMIHGTNVYDENILRLETDLAGWGGHSEFFGKMIGLTKPELIIEVGTWKGRSAVSMAKLLDDALLINKDVIFSDKLEDCSFLVDAKILCVDTFLGATEFVNAPKGSKRDLRAIAGWPQIYNQFVSNVMNEHLEHRIIPFPQTSTNAARFFKKNGVKAELIYIDASHEYEDVLTDLYAWQDVLAKGGLMFGDDYCQHWSGVIEAVDQFAYANNLIIDTFSYENEFGNAPSDYWVLSKKGIEF